MCIFSRSVRSVSSTNIFARQSTKGYQYLVYSMSIEADKELAMILPLPVPPNPAEEAVNFINLEKYPEFFDEMKLGFPVPRTRGLVYTKASKGISKLKVEQVGLFEASFVPTLKDFDRLDERFKLSPDIWKKLPQYETYGFAVFKLKESKGEQKVHPMAFRFPSKLDQLFFPTVHIHDGHVTKEADFDHCLYLQTYKNTMGWTKSIDLASEFITNYSKSQRIIDPDSFVYQQQLEGLFENIDILV